MSESLLMAGILVLLCGVLVMCIFGTIFLGVLAVRVGEEREKCVPRVSVNDGEPTRADSGLFRQWDNLLGYNGSEGDDLDE